MINWLHTYQPSRILIEIGPFSIYWYGALYLVAFAVGLVVVRWIARRKGVPTDQIFDCAVWMFLGGLVGARLWYVFLIEPIYFLRMPLEAFAIWHGGLAIHGGIIGALAVLWWWTRRHHIDLLPLADLFVPALALGQAIGRWGNYFNQELYGRATALPWGIPIDFGDAVSGMSVVVHVHPLFLYESLANIILFALLLTFSLRSPRPGRVAALYLMGYSIIRFSMEFLRIDPTPTWILRLPQWVSLGILIAAVSFLMYDRRKRV